MAGNTPLCPRAPALGPDSSSGDRSWGWDPPPSTLATRPLPNPPRQAGEKLFPQGESQHPMFPLVVLEIGVSLNLCA